MEVSSPVGSRNATRWFLWAGVLLILSLAAYLRCHLVSSGLPGVVYPRTDEVNYVTHVNALLCGVWVRPPYINPYLYPMVLTVTAAIRGVLAIALGTCSSWSEYAVANALSSWSVVTTGRFLSLVLSVCSVGLLWRLGRRMLSVGAAGVAAVMLATNATHIWRSVLVGNEVLMVLWVILLLDAVYAFLRNPSVRRHLLCGLLLGLAAATKYNAGIQVLPLVVASLLVAYRQGAGWRARLRLSWRVLPGFAVALLVFVLANPSLFFDGAAMWKAFQLQSGFLHGGYVTQDVTLALSGWCYYPSNFARLNNGLGPALLCAAGLLYVGYRAVRFRDDRALLLLSATLPSYLVLGSGIFHQMRFLLPAIPFLLLAGGWALQDAVDCMLQKMGCHPGLGARVALSVGLVLVLPQTVRLAGGLERSYGRADARAQLLMYAREHLPQSGSYVQLSFTPRVQVLKQRWDPDRRLLDRLPPAMRPVMQEQVRRRYDAVDGYTLLAQSEHFSDLMAQLAEGGFTHIVVTGPMRLDAQGPEGLSALLERFPLETYHPALRGCPYWPEWSEWLCAHVRGQASVYVDPKERLGLWVIPVPDPQKL